MVKFTQLSHVQKLSYILFALSAIMLIGTVLFAVNSTDVITYWKLELPKGDIHAGDRILVQSTYTKVRNANGIAVRYLDCKNKNGIVLRYELNQRKADRAARTGGTGIDVTLPTDVPDLPAKCKIAVAICYDTIFPWYCHPESNETDEFMLLPKVTSQEETTSVVEGNGGSLETSQTPMQSSIQSSIQSSPNSTLKEETSQSETSQKGVITTLLDDATKTVNNLLGGL